MTPLTKKIGELVEEGSASIQTGPFGTQLKASDYSPDGVPVINVRNIGYGNLRDEKLEFLPEATAERLSVHVLTDKDIVFGRKGAVDRHLFVTDGQSGWIQGSDCIRLRLDDKKINPQFVSYAFLSQHHKEWMLQQCGSKATMASLNQDVIRRIELRWLKREHQDEVVSILSAYDDLIENNRRRIALLEEAARLLYREWFVYFRFPGHEHVKIVDGLPEGWKKTVIREAYVGLFDGPHATPAPSDEGPAFLGITNIRETGGLDLSDIRHVSEAEFPKWTRRVTPIEGDIVFSYEATLNRYALIPRNLRCCLGRRLALIRPKDGYRYFIFLHMFSESWRSTIAGRVISGATVDRIPLKTFPEFPFMLPSQRVAMLFNDFVEPQFRQIEVLHEQNQKLAQARDLLLPRLMSGEISV